jgi:short-subunit dehydrogenase
MGACKEQCCLHLFEMKKAIVVGATSGIGEGLTNLLVKANYRVGITGRRTALLDKIYSRFPNNILTKTFDVDDVAMIGHHLDALVYDLGGLDLLIISSGTGDLNPNLDFDIENKTIATNVLGYTSLADWAFNYFVKQGFGHLAGISSIAGLYGGRYAPAYNASKAYQISYLQGLRQHAKHLKRPILITDIRPGFVATAMAKGEGQFWVATVEKASMQIFSAIQNKRKVVYVSKKWRLIAWILMLKSAFHSVLFRS